MHAMLGTRYYKTATWSPCSCASFLGSCGMKATIKTYLLASSIPHFFSCSDITTSFMTALPFSIFYSWKNQSLSLSSILAYKAIDKISVTEILWFKLKQGYCSNLRVVTEKAPLSLLFILIFPSYLCGVCSFIFCLCWPRRIQFSAAAWYVSYSEHWYFMKAACSHQATNYIGF